MSNEKKNVRITKAMRYNDVIAILSDESPKYGTDKSTAIKFLFDELVLLNRKNSSPSKADKEKAALRDKNKQLILDWLESNVPPADSLGFTCTDILKGIPSLESNQRVSSLCKVMADDGYLTKLSKSGKTYYVLSDNAEEG